MNSRFVQRALGAIVLLVGFEALYTLLVACSLGAPQRLVTLHHVAEAVATLVGIAGTVVAARTFSPGDHLRRVWTLMAINLCLIGVGVASRRLGDLLAPGQALGALPVLAPLDVLRIVATNLASSYALILLVTTFRQAGLVAPPSWPFRVLGALLVAVAAAMALLTIRAELARTGISAAGTYGAINDIASTLGDVVTVVLIMPILRSAYMLRGGRVAWAWWAMGIGGVAWLVEDSSIWLVPLFQGAHPGVGAIVDCVRPLAIALSGLAGWLQHEALASAGVELSASAEPLSQN